MLDGKVPDVWQSLRRLSMRLLEVEGGGSSREGRESGLLSRRGWKCRGRDRNGGGGRGGGGGVRLSRE